MNKKEIKNSVYEFFVLGMILEGNTTLEIDEFCKNSSSHTITEKVKYFLNKDYSLPLEEQVLFYDIDYDYVKHELQEGKLRLLKYGDDITKWLKNLFKTKKADDVIRGTNKADDAAKVTSKADDAAKVTSKADDAAKVTSKADDVAKAKLNRKIIGTTALAAGLGTLGYHSTNSSSDSGSDSGSGSRSGSGSGSGSTSSSDFDKLTPAQKGAFLANLDPNKQAKANKRYRAAVATGGIVSTESINTNNDYDAYDLILEYLLENGHADTISEANYIMLKLDSQSMKTIVEMGIPD